MTRQRRPSGSERRSRGKKTMGGGQGQSQKKTGGGNDPIHAGATGLEKQFHGEIRKKKRALGWENGDTERGGRERKNVREENNRSAEGPREEKSSRC